MRCIQKIYFNILSGPFRPLKKALFAVSTAILIILALLTFLPVLENVGATIAIGYAIGLLTLIIFIQSKLSAKLNDIRCMLSLHFNLNTKGYRVTDFFMDAAAADASLCLFLLKCLISVRPRSVLELGSGQTTKLLANYYAENPDAYVLSLENNEAWAQTVRKLITLEGKCHDIRYSPLESYEFSLDGLGLTIRTNWYQHTEELSNHNFDLILVDGPNGTPHLSRSGILKYIPEILAPSFVIIIDDAGRYGEISTIQVLKRLLKSRGVDFLCWEMNGIKRQYVLCSKTLAFLRYY